MQRPSRWLTGPLLLALFVLIPACLASRPRDVDSNPAALAQQPPQRSFEHRTDANAKGIGIDDFHASRSAASITMDASRTASLRESSARSSSADLVQFLKSL